LVVFFVFEGIFDFGFAGSTAAGSDDGTGADAPLT
jgi:hypothetical protein